MSLYSDFLFHYIHNKNIKVAALIEYCQIDRSTMYKIINGKRNPPHKELVDKIAYFLKLSPQERKKYYYSYYCTLIGEQRYKQYKEVEFFLLNCETPQNIKLEEKSHYVYQRIEEIITIKGNASLNYYIEYLLEREALQDYPEVYYIGQNNYDFLLNILKNIGYSQNRFSLHQILCLDNQSEMMTQNIKQIEKSIVLSNYISHYDLRFYYDNVRSHFGGINLFNYMLICPSSGVITFTDDFQYGLLYNRQDVIELYKDIYNQYQMNT